MHTCQFCRKKSHFVQGGIYYCQKCYEHKFPNEHHRPIPDNFVFEGKGLKEIHDFTVLNNYHTLCVSFPPKVYFDIMFYGENSNGYDINLFCLERYSGRLLEVRAKTGHPEHDNGDFVRFSDCSVATFKNILAEKYPPRFLKRFEDITEENRQTYIGSYIPQDMTSFVNNKNAIFFLKHQIGDEIHIVMYHHSTINFTKSLRYYVFDTDVFNSQPFWGKELTEISNTIILNSKAAKKYKKSSCQYFLNGKKGRYFTELHALFRGIEDKLAEKATIECSSRANFYFSVDLSKKYSEATLSEREIDPILAIARTILKLK